MDKNKVFCCECRDDVHYSISEKQMVGKLKGIDYEYVGKIAECEVCNSEVYVKEIEDYNLKALYDSYRKENDIISLEKIQEIPKKYNIGKENLSLLLGWGATTFSRYCDEYVPTKQYSDILQRIYDEPKYYLRCLNLNKEKLKSETSYEKSKKATELLIVKIGNSRSKIQLVVDYILSKVGEITPLALQKTLYYIQGFHLAFYNKPFFEDDCEAWVHGPVYKEIYSKYSEYCSFSPIDNNNDNFDSTVFSTTEKCLLDSVIKNICCYSGNTLECFTHAEPPWSQTRGVLPENARSNQEIKKGLIKNYFTKVKNKYNMLTPLDINKYALYMFSHTQK